VRSAVIHTIALARTSITHTRSWAANSYNARIRLKTENERLQTEIQLLLEEIRIKDARWRAAPRTGGPTTRRPSDSPSSS
jgi:hypothetical protein